MRTKILFGVLLLSVALCSRGFSGECCAPAQRLAARKPACCEKACGCEKTCCQRITPVRDLFCGLKDLFACKHCCACETCGPVKGCCARNRPAVRSPLAVRRLACCKPACCENRLAAAKTSRLLREGLRLREEVLPHHQALLLACCELGCCEKPACCAKPACCEKACWLREGLRLRLREEVLPSSAGRPGQRHLHREVPDLHRLQVCGSAVGAAEGCGCGGAAPPLRPPLRRLPRKTEAAPLPAAPAPKPKTTSSDESA